MEPTKKNEKINPSRSSDSCSVDSREGDVSRSPGPPSPPRLKTELKRLIESFGDTTEENSVLEVHMKEVKIKEHKLSSQSECAKDNRKKNNEDDSERTDTGIPPIPDCEEPKLKEICRRKSVIVRDHTNKHKLYVPGRIKSQFFMCPHRTMDCKQETMPTTGPGARRDVNRYHYNHYGLRNLPRTKHYDDRPGFFKRLCVRRKKRPTKSVISETAVRQPIFRRTIKYPTRIDRPDCCYCCIDMPEKTDQATSATSLVLDGMDVESQTRRCICNEMDFRSKMLYSRSRYTGSHGQIQFVTPEDHQYYKNLKDLSDESFPGKSKKAEIVEEKVEGKGYPAGYTQALCKPERVDIYLFDHQDSRYFHTTDNPPPIHTEMAVHTTEEYMTLFWAEVFGVIHIGVAFIMALILQTLKFILVAILRPLVTGPIQLVSDYLLKPLLTIVFNGILQPIIIFLYNLATSLRDLLQPIAKGVGYLIREASVPLQAFRIVDVKAKTNNGPFYAQPVRTCATCTTKV